MCSTTRSTRTPACSARACHGPGGNRKGESVHYLSATEVLAQFRSGELSPVELVSAVIERAETVEPRINAFAATYFDEALDAAREAEKRYRVGDARPLEGLPVAVKEEAPIAGKPNTLGSLPLRGEVATQTAPFVQRIIDAGGIVHAQTTTPEFCCAPVTWTKLWGVTRNPWNTAYAPGGSSGGSAAALASGTQRSRPVRTSAARSASRPLSVASSASNRRTVACPRSRSSTSIITATKAQWREPSPIALCWRT